MGTSSSRQPRQMKKPLKIERFRHAGSSSEQCVIPEVPEKRKVTDFICTVFFAGCIALLVAFLTYTFIYSDINRLILGYDTCGNVCGRKNTKVDGIECSGVDETDKPLLKYAPFNIGRFQLECVKDCNYSNHIRFMNTCFPGSKLHENKLATDINKAVRSTVALCFIGFGLNVGMLFLFRYFVDVVVWVILISLVAGFISLAKFLWDVHIAGIVRNDGLPYVAIIITVTSVVLVIILICMFKRIKLLIRLFKEAIKIIFAMPLILIEPILTFVAVIILLIIYVFCKFMFATSGTLEPTYFEQYGYVPNGAIMFTIIWHIVICLWVRQFIMDCQYVVISGAVSAYYFARDKSTLTTPIYNSFYNLMKYHLGTVAFGSLIITVITLIKTLIRGLTNIRQTNCLPVCCMESIDSFLKFLSKNAYIQTAMHGQPFFKSGKRAARLLYANFTNTIVVNSVGDFVINVAKLLIIVCTVGFGVFICDESNEFFWAAIGISAVVTAVTADCFLTVFQIAVDTILLCYCEDRLLNDGMARPYYMTTSLMQYVEDARNTVR